MKKQFLLIALLCTLLLILICFSCILFPCRKKPVAEPVAVLTNIKGEKTTRFAVMDSVFASFCGLIPGGDYNLRIIRSDGRIISSLTAAADQRGIIPTTALWWEIGVTYSGDRSGRLDPKSVSDYEFFCELRLKERTVIRTPVIIEAESRQPVVFSSDKDGNPLNGFIHGEEDVFCSGYNFPPGSELFIYATEDQTNWEPGMRLQPVTKIPLVVRLKENEDGFRVRLWERGATRTGAYDIIVKLNRKAEIYELRDFIDSCYAGGFVVCSPQPSPAPPHIEAELACQAPPRDPATGTVIGAPNPFYKDLFATAEEVWLAVNPYTGGGNYAYQTARLYIVNQKTAAEWVDGTVLNDVSGGYESTTIQPGCANVNYNRIWSSPVIREAGYDVVVDFTPFGVYTRGIDIIDKLDLRGFYVPLSWVCLESISFNHNSGSAAADALNIRKNFTQDVTVPEWQKAQVSHPAAYIKNKTVTVEAVFSAGAGVTSAEIWATTSYGSLGNPLKKTVNFSSGLSGPVSFSLDAATPGTIRSFYQSWQWYCENVNASASAAAGFSQSKNRIFIVLDQPQGPWTTAGQTEPWESALVRSCYWASGEATAAGAADKIARQLFSNTGGKYDTQNGAPKYTGSVFHLTNFINNIPAVDIVNCYDMANAVVIFSNILGCGLAYRYSGPFGYLNCIHAIGRGWTNNPFYAGSWGYSTAPIVPGDDDAGDGRSYFGNHAFGGIGNNIFDACLTVDTDTDPDYGPPFQETWMTNIPWNSYKGYVVDNNPASSTANPVTHVYSID